MIRLRSVAAGAVRLRGVYLCRAGAYPLAAHPPRQPQQQQQQKLTPAAPTALSLVRFQSTTTRGNERQLSIEEQYSRKTPVEHVLLRPGMYVGPTERLPPTTCWVPDTLPDPSCPSSSSAGDLNSTRMVQRECSLVPALNKVFDEILVNASDNRLRHPKSCSRVDVTIDPGCAEGTDRRPPLISVYNDGKGIPVQIHRKEKMYVPEMVFGHLMTGFPILGDSFKNGLTHFGLLAKWARSEKVARPFPQGPTNTQPLGAN